jgi:hypothetical protein
MLSALLLFSCSNDDDNKVPPPLQNDCESTGLYKYTECCIEGPIQAKQDQVISFTYTSNFESAGYEWEVLGNSMTLVEGQNSETAKFRTAKNFVSDSIVAFSRTTDGGKACSHVVIISAY